MVGVKGLEGDGFAVVVEQDDLVEGCFSVEHCCPMLVLADYCYFPMLALPVGCCYFPMLVLLSYPMMMMLALRLRRPMVLVMSQSYRPKHPMMERFPMVLVMGWRHPMPALPDFPILRLTVRFCPMDCCRPLVFELRLQLSVPPLVQRRERPAPSPQIQRLLIRKAWF